MTENKDITSKHIEIASGSLSIDQLRKKALETPVLPVTEPRVQKKDEENKVSSESVVQAGERIGGAILGGELLEAGINEAGKVIRRTLHGGTGERKHLGEGGNEEENLKNKLTFEEMRNALESGQIEKSQRRQYEKEMKKMVEDVKSLDDGNYIKDLRSGLIMMLRKTEWDDMPKAVSEFGIEQDRLLVESRIKGAYPELRGIVAQEAVAVAAELRAEGIHKKETSGDSDIDDWRKKHAYDEETAARYYSVAKKNRVLDILPDGVVDLVGVDLKHEETSPSQPASKDSVTKKELLDLLDAIKNGQSNVTANMIREAMGQASREEIERLYRDAEKGMYSIPFELDVPKFLVGSSKETIDEWQARARLSSACFAKRSAKGPDELAQNEAAQGMTNEQLEKLLTMPGVLDALSIECGLLVSKKSPHIFRDQVLQVALPDNLDMLNNCPEFLNQIQEGKQLEGYREVKIAWLMAFRGLDRKTAEDAEVVSRNLTFLANVLEDYDTRYQYRTINGKTQHYFIKDYRFTKPTVPIFKSLSAWQLIHPQERLQAKVESSDEAWSMFGPYALNKYKVSQIPLNMPVVGGALKFLLNVPIVGKMLKETGLGWSVASERFYPTRLIPNAFTYNKDGHKDSFMSSFLKNFDKLAENPMTSENDLNTPYFGGSMTEGPFAGYSFLQLSPAATIFNVLNNPGKFDRNWAGLGNALRNCNVPKFYRERMVLGIHGVNASWTLALTPVGGEAAYNGTVTGLLAADPSFFS